MEVARTEVAAAGLADRVYVAGGFTADGRASAVVEVYDTKADRWDRIPDLPEGRHHAGLAAARGAIWLIGGYDEAGKPSGLVWRWAPGDRGWSRGPALPTARGALSVAVVHDGIHAIGGATGLGGGSRLSGEHAFLAPGADRWTTLDPLPEPRDHLAAAGIATVTSAGGSSLRSGTIYVVGGRHLSLDSNEARVDVFDIPDAAGPKSRWRWTEAFAMPRARGGTSAVVAGVVLVALGGEEPSGTIGPVDHYEVEDGVWCGGPPMPTPRHGLGAVAIGSRIYVVGGGPTPGLSVSRANEVLEISG